MIPIRQLSICATLAAGLMATQPGSAEPPKVVKPVSAVVKPGIAPTIPGGILMLKPDLVVSLSCDSKATAGANLAVTVTVTNKGTVKALGTIEGPADKAYMIDLVWSSDSVIPAKTAIQPGYQGLTKEDFVEDMLVLGGRISNTQSINPGASVTYNLPAYVPKNIQPGVYWLGAYVDSIAHVSETNETNNTTSTKVQIGSLQGSTTTVPTGVKLWVMPYAIGGTPLYQIKPTGLTDYTDGLSGTAMNDAPFGGRLGFRHGYHNSLPTPQLFYYRWQYRPAAGGDWKEFTESVGAHYVRQVGATISFPVYPLGPKNVGGKNLYEFRPVAPPSEAGAVTTWPATDWFGDIYSGFLNSPALSEGTYQFKLEIYNNAGTVVAPGATTFSFIVPVSTAADGTITTALGASLDGAGYVFNLHVDNRHCTAVIDPPNGPATDDCGFLLYNPASDASLDANKIRMAFHATHPANHAVFAFDTIRATTNVIDLNGEVAALNVGGFTGDGHGNFSHLLPRTQLLGGCLKAAFAELLYVYPKATNGWNQRLTAYDASAARAFALAPQ